MGALSRMAVTVATLARDPRIAFVGLGVITGAIMYATVKTLATIRDSVEVKPVPPKTQYITQETEDALKIDTLDMLLRHPNDSVRAVASKILCDRVINDEAGFETVLRGVTSTDYETRTMSLRALDFLLQQNTHDTLIKLHSDKAYSAMVRCLELAHKEGETPALNNDHWDEFPLRDGAERRPLCIIADLVSKYGIDKLVRSKFVKKWLKQQPWGDDESERQRNFRHYVNTKPGNRIVCIITKLLESPRGYKALQRARLVSPYLPPKTTRIVWAEDGEAGADGGSSGGDNHPRPRPREHSAEEQRLRRQHREAMVLNDGTRPLGRDDIIERDHD